MATPDSITVTVLCSVCRHRGTATSRALPTSMCPACGNPLLPCTPETLAKEALDRALAPSPIPKTHKRDTRPTAPRTTMKRLLRELRDQK